MGEGEGGKGAEGGCDKYPKNRAGSRLAGEIRKGKTRIKGEEAATERGLGNIKRKKIRRRTKERITQVRERLFIFAFWLTPGMSGMQFIYRRIIYISSYLNN